MERIERLSICTGSTKGPCASVKRSRQKQQLQLRRRFGAAVGRPCPNLASERPDLILMDLNLSDLDGREATRRIQANPKTATIPSIALAAHAFETDVVKAMEADCDALR